MISGAITVLRPAAQGVPPGTSLPAGPPGPPGPAGPAGPAGAPGANGQDGINGTPGPAGNAGAPGPQGDAGPKGDTGPTGPLAWQTPPVAWAASTAYAATPPASTVTYGGESYVCAVGHTSGSTFDASKWAKLAAKGEGSAIVSDGTANTPSPQAAVDLAYTLGTSVVLRNVVQPLTAALMTRPGVKVYGELGGGLSRAGIIVEFDSYVAHGARLENLILDGGWNGTDTADNSLAIYNTKANDTAVFGCTLRNMKGSAVYQNGTLRFNIERNTFQTVGAIGVAINNSAPLLHYSFIYKNTFNDVRQHAVLGVMGGEITIEGNTAIDPSVTGLTVSLSGAAGTTTITTATTPDFTNARVGSFIVINGGLEYLITGKASNTSITGSLTSGAYPGTLTNVPAIMGTGDQINMQSGYGNRILRNVVKGGVTAGILVWDDGSHPNAVTTIEGNRVENAGNAGICTQATGTSTTDTTIRGNTVRNAGQGGSASAANWNVGIYVFGAPAYTAVLANTILDDQATPTTQYPIAVNGAPAGSVAISGNTWRGMANDNVRGGLSSIVLGAGWGTTATASALTWTETGWSFTITAGGTGIAASPTMTVNHPAFRGGGAPLTNVLVTRPATSNVPTLCFIGTDAAAVTTVVVGGLTPVDGGVYKVFGKI